MPSVVPCSLSPLSLFLNWRRTVSSKLYNAQVSSISIAELVLPSHARCALSRFRCNGHSLLLSSYLSRIGSVKNPSCSACGHPFHDTSHLILHCPATDCLYCSLFGESLSLLRPLVQALESCSDSGSPWSSTMLHPFIRRVGQQQQHARFLQNLWKFYAYNALSATIASVFY